MPLRVLHVAQPTTGGVAHYLAPLVADQQRRGYDVTVACPSDGHLWTDVADAGGRHLPWPARRSPGFSVGAEALRLKRIVRDVAPDLVHLHSSKAGLVGRLIRVDRGRPTLFQPHGWSWLAVPEPVATLSRAWERIAALRCDRLVCVSGAERRLGEQAGISARWEVVPTGVDLARFRPGDPGRRPTIRQRLDAPAAPLAVCVGRLSEAKGQDLLVRLWPRVREQVPRAELVLVGDGELRPLVESLARDGVRLLGNRSDVAEWYTAADVVVVPSRWDALSLSLAEAAASGSCVVATDVPGVREILGDSERGAVVPSGDDGGLVDALVRRLSDPAAAAAEGAALGRWAQGHLDRSATFDRIATIVQELVSARPVHQ